MEQISFALELATSSAILFLAAIIGIGYPYSMGVFTISLALLCFLLVFILAFCLLSALKLGARLSTSKKALIIAAAVASIAIICVMSA